LIPDDADGQRLRAARLLADASRAAAAVSGDSSYLTTRTATSRRSSRLLILRRRHRARLRTTVLAMSLFTTLLRGTNMGSSATGVAFIR
jgi:hypothetical protein